MGYNNELIIPNILMIVTLSLLLPIAFPIIPDTELGHICGLADPSNLSFTNNFNNSRFLVAIALRINTASHDGFWNAKIAWANSNEWCYGLASCRGDVSPGNCTACVNKATLTLINDHCPDARSAIIWNDYCFFKYSDTDFLGKVDTDNTHTLTSEYIYSLPSSKDTTMNLLSNLIQTAIQNSNKFYAKGSDRLPILNGTQYDPAFVYGMVQCTRDLTPDDCVKCLNVTLMSLQALKQAPKQGEHVVRGSCNLRYETYDFSNN